MSQAYPGPHPLYAFSPSRKTRRDQLEYDINTAMQRAFAPHPFKYTKAVVLMLSFDNDDLGFGGLEKELGDVFRTFYQYTVRYVKLQSGGNPNMDLSKALHKIDDDNFTMKDSLIILTFSGHSVVDVDTTTGKKSLHIGGSCDAKSGKINGSVLHWRETTNVLAHVDASVVHLLDCCFAAEAGLPSADLLAATSGTEVAAGNLATCFTRGLIEELKMSSSSGISMAQLYSNLLHNRRAFNLEYYPVYATRPGKEPIYIHHLGEQGPKSVLPVPSNDNDRPRVLITAHVEEDFSKREAEDLKKWLLKDVPHTVKGLEVRPEGIFRSNSSLLLLTVPAEMWTQLPENPALNFLAQVYSDNELLRWTT